MAASPSEAILNAQSTNDEFPAAVTYNSVASVIKQYKKPSSTSDGTLAASSGSLNRSVHKNGDCYRPKTSLMMRYRCDTCAKYGHWKRSRRTDGSLPPGVKSLDNPQLPATSSKSEAISDEGSLPTDRKSKTISFKMATFTDPTEMPLDHGPLVDSDAPYSAIGSIDLNMLADHFSLQSNPPLGPIPKALDGYTSWQYVSRNNPRGNCFRNQNRVVRILKL